MHGLLPSHPKVQQKSSAPKPALKDLQDTAVNEAECRNPADFSGCAACLNPLSRCYCQPACWESRKPPLARREPGSPVTWQQKGNPGQASPCQGGGRAPSAARTCCPAQCLCCWNTGAFSSPSLTHFVGETAQIAQIVWIRMA